MIKTFSEKTSVMKCRFVWTQQMTYVTFTLVKRLSKPSLTIQFKSINRAPKGSRQSAEIFLRLV